MARISKRLIIAAAAVVALLALALVAVLFTELDSPELRRLALDQVGEASGFDLEAKGFRLNLLHGLELEEVEVLAEDDGRINLSMLVTGRLDGSAIRLNKAYLEQLAKRYVGKRVENELGKALKGLLGND